MVLPRSVHTAHDLPHCTNFLVHWFYQHSVIRHRVLHAASKWPLRPWLSTLLSLVDCKSLVCFSPNAANVKFCHPRPGYLHHVFGPSESWTQHFQKASVLTIQTLHTLRWKLCWSFLQGTPLLWHASLRGVSPSGGHYLEVCRSRKSVRMLLGKNQAPSPGPTRLTPLLPVTRAWRSSSNRWTCHNIVV